MVLSSIASSIVHEPSEVIPAPPQAVEHVLPWVKGQVARLLFWAAIALPVCYLYLLLDGIASTGELRLFLELFGLHVLALLGGSYHR
jgi:hypothetical protein